MAAGMLKAWKILRIEKQRNKDAIAMVIIVSDGITNIPLKRPLTKRGQRTLLSDSQSDVFDVTRLLIRDDVRVIVINTAHRQDELLIREREGKLPLRARWYLPTEFLMELAQTAKGSYYGLSLKQEEDLIKGSKLEQWFYLAS
jgi:Mg-chelatase subunit ChlD